MIGTSLEMELRLMTPNRVCPHELGDKVTFVPTAFIDVEQYHYDPRTAHRLTGRVVAINEKRRTYTVEAECHGYVLRECFKF